MVTAVSSLHLIIRITFILQNIDNVNIILLLASFIRVIILIVALVRRYLLVLVNGIRVLTGMLFCRSSQITLRILLRIRILYNSFAFLILKSGDLLLGALHELVDLALSLVLNGVISSLDIRWVNRILTTAPRLFSALISHLNSRLRSTRAWTWSSNLMVLTLFDIFTLDYLIFYIILLSISVDYVDSKSVKLIEWPYRIIFVDSSLYVVGLSSFLHLVRANKLITRLLFLVWMILIVFETFLRLLLLRVVLLILPILIFRMARILILLVFVELLIWLPSRMSCSILLLRITIVLLVLNLYLVIELFELVLVCHIVSLI